MGTGVQMVSDVCTYEMAGKKNFDTEKKSLNFQTCRKTYYY